MKRAIVAFGLAFWRMRSGRFACWVIVSIWGLLWVQVGVYGLTGTLPPPGGPEPFTLWDTFEAGGNLVLVALAVHGLFTSPRARSEDLEALEVQWHLTAANWEQASREATDESDRAYYYALANDRITCAEQLAKVRAG